jgi:hypothetical protein
MFGTCAGVGFDRAFSLRITRSAPGWEEAIERPEVEGGPRAVVLVEAVRPELEAVAAIPLLVTPFGKVKGRNEKDCGLDLAQLHWRSPNPVRVGVDQSRCVKRK